MPRRGVQKTAAVGLALLGLFGLWVYQLDQWAKSVVPAGDTLADHLEHRPPASRVRVFEVEGREHVALLGPWQAFPRFPSGPPVYVFDASGRLVTWCPDTGDGNIDTKWHGAYSGREITPAELARWPGATR